MQLRAKVEWTGDASEVLVEKEDQKKIPFGNGNWEFLDILWFFSISIALLKFQCELKLNIDLNSPAPKSQAENWRGNPSSISWPRWRAAETATLRPSRSSQYEAHWPAAEWQVDRLEMNLDEFLLVPAINTDSISKNYLAMECYFYLHPCPHAHKRRGSNGTHHELPVYRPQTQNWSEEAYSGVDCFRLGLSNSQNQWSEKPYILCFPHFPTQTIIPAPFWIPSLESPLLCLSTPPHAI